LIVYGPLRAVKTLTKFAPVSVLRGSKGGRLRYFPAGGGPYDGWGGFVQRDGGVGEVAGGAAGFREEVAAADYAGERLRVRRGGWLARGASRGSCRYDQQHARRIAGHAPRDTVTSGNRRVASGPSPGEAAPAQV